jgi:hypothetical protein
MPTAEETATRAKGEELGIERSREKIEKNNGRKPL